MELTNGKTMVPPIVWALFEFQPFLIFDFLGNGCGAQRPSAQVDEHHQQNGYHPLKQLFVRQLDFVRWLHSIGERHPPSLHQEGCVRDAET